MSTSHEEHEHQGQINKLYKKLKDLGQLNHLLDSYYGDMLMIVQKLSILLSTGMWLVKDSNIQPRCIYLATSVNNYISVFDRITVIPLEKILKLILQIMIWKTVKK